MNKRQPISHQLVFRVSIFETAYYKRALVESRKNLQVFKVYFTQTLNIMTEYRYSLIRFHPIVTNSLLCRL